jgi:hypothetical protein
MKYYRMIVLSYFMNMFVNQRYRLSENPPTVMLDTLPKYLVIESHLCGFRSNLFVASRLLHYNIWGLEVYEGSCYVILEYDTVQSGR